MSSTPVGEPNQMDTTTTTTGNDVRFQNNGIFAWMVPYLKKMGIQEGKTLMYGPLAFDLDEATKTSMEQAQKLRELAAESLVNIGPAERERRNQAGTVMLALSAIYISWATLFADDGGIGGHILRFLGAIPLFFAVGYKVSAKRGLCNIAQAGLWDVDGNGLTQIKDAKVASTILNEVNQMNLDSLLKVTIPMFVFALLPQSTSTTIVTVGLILGALYALQDKLPSSASNVD